MKYDVDISFVNEDGDTIKETAVRLIKVTKQMLNNGYIKRLLGNIGTVTIQKNGKKKLMILTKKGNRHVKSGVHIGETWKGNWHILNKSTQDILIWPPGGNPIWRR